MISEDCRASVSLRSAVLGEGGGRMESSAVRDTPDIYVGLHCLELPSQVVTVELCTNSSGRGSDHHNLAWVQQQTVRETRKTLPVREIETETFKSFILFRLENSGLVENRVRVIRIIKFKKKSFYWDFLVCSLGFQKFGLLTWIIRPFQCN